MSNLSVAERPEQAETTLRSIAESVFRQKTPMLVAGLATLLAGLLFAFLPAKKYESEMVLLVANARTNPALSAGATGSEAALAVTDAQVQAEVEALNSNDVLDDVVDPGWNSVPETSRSNEAVIEHQDKVGSLQGRLIVTPGKKANTIQVQYRNRDAQEAHAVIERLLNSFLTKQADLGQPAQAPKFFTDEAARYKQDWLNAQADLVKFQLAHGIFSVTDTQASSQRLMETTNSQLLATDVLIRETADRIQAEEAELRGQPSRVPTLELSAERIGVMDNLATQQITLNLKRTELLTKYLPTDRLVQEVDKQLAQVDAAMKEINSQKTSSVTTNINPTWQAADQDLSASRSLLKAAAGRRAQLAAEMAQLQKQIGTTTAASSEFLTLQSKVTELQANYDLYAKKRDEAIANSGMDANRLLNVAVLENPTYSPTAIRPRPLLDTLLALFTALFIASLVVFVAEASRSTFSNARELDSLQGGEVLATIPWEGRRP